MIEIKGVSVGKVENNDTYDKLSHWSVARLLS